jgi:hypothetical protein
MKNKEESEKPNNGRVARDKEVRKAGSRKQEEMEVEEIPNVISTNSKGVTTSLQSQT